MWPKINKVRNRKNFLNVKNTDAGNKKLKWSIQRKYYG